MFRVALVNRILRKTNRKAVLRKMPRTGIPSRLHGELVRHFMSPLQEIFGIVRSSFAPGSGGPPQNRLTRGADFVEASYACRVWRGLYNFWMLGGFLRRVRHPAPRFHDQSRGLPPKTLVRRI